MPKPIGFDTSVLPSCDIDNSGSGSELSDEDSKNFESFCRSEWLKKESSKVFKKKKKYEKLGTSLIEDILQRKTTYYQTFLQIIQNRIILALIIVLIAVICLACLGSKEKVVEVKSFKERVKGMKKAFENIRSDFPSQNKNVWSSVSSGFIDAIKDDPRASVITFLHKPETDKTADCLALRFAKAGISYFKLIKKDPIIIDGTELESYNRLTEDYGVLINEYIPKLIESKIMVTYDLEKIPGYIAQGFHTLCDVYAPPAEDIVCLFTLGTNLTSEENSHIAAQKLLKEKWKADVEEDKLDPLISRLTELVVPIVPESLNSQKCNVK